MSRRVIPPPHPSRCSTNREDYADIVSAHERAVRRGQPTYFDPATGFSVLTFTTLLDRGTCCHNGCRHCPFIED